MEEILVFGEQDGFGLGNMLQVSLRRSEMPLQTWSELRAQKGDESTVYKLGFIIPPLVLGYELEQDCPERECVVGEKSGNYLCDSNMKCSYNQSEGPGQCLDDMTRNETVIQLGCNFQNLCFGSLYILYNSSLLFLLFSFQRIHRRSYGKSWLRYYSPPTNGEFFSLLTSFLGKKHSVLCFFSWLFHFQIRDTVPHRQLSCLRSPCGHPPFHQPWDGHFMEEERVLHNHDQMYDLFLN